MTSDLVQHEAHVSLLAEAATQTAEDLQTKSFVGCGVVSRMDIHLDLFRGSGRKLLMCTAMTMFKTAHVFQHTCCGAPQLTWLEDTVWLHWLDAKLPSTLKFFSSNRKPVTADFLPSSWLAERNHAFI